MSLRVERYRRRKARGELRGDLLFPLVVLGALGLLFTGSGLLSLGSPLGWARLAGGLVFGAVGYGIHRGRIWARWPAAGILVVLCAFDLLRVLDGRGALVAVVHLVACGVGAVYLVLPSTGRRFLAARDPDGQGDPHDPIRPATPAEP
jgi:hypothetical protein